MTVEAWLGISVIAVTVIYTIIRIWGDGNLEKDALAIFLGGTLAGMMVLYFFYPPFHAFVDYLLSIFMRFLTAKTI